MLAASCGKEANDEEAGKTEERVTRTSDMDFFELHDAVRECDRITYYDVTWNADTVALDTAASRKNMVSAYFDKLGHYVKKRHERIERDADGNITRWEDRRPNSKGLHGGFLKDTLAYNRLNPAVMTSSGMGDFSVVVRDTLGNIVGQHTEPAIDGTTVSAFNIIRATDERGNWTERLTVWTSQSPGGKPHVSYTLDRRSITYYD